MHSVSLNCQNKNGLRGEETCQYFRSISVNTQLGLLFRHHIVSNNVFPDKSIQAFFARVTHWPIRVRISLKWRMWAASSAGGKGPVVSLSIKNAQTHRMSSL